MRRTGTLILIAAIGVLGALAVADAVRPGGEPRPAAAPTTTTRPKPPTLLDTLRREAVSGFLLYSDQDCALHSLLISQMIDSVVRREDERGAVHRCRFAIVGGRIVGERFAEQAHGLKFRGGGIVAGDHVLLTRRDLVAAARRHPNLAGYDRRIPLRIFVTSIARPSAREVLVGMEVSARYLEPQFVAAVFRDRELVGVGASFHGPYVGLFTSADGSMVGAENGTIFMPDGRTIDPPDDLPAGRAVAFSPGGRWVARVNGISVFLVGTPLNDQPGRIIRLPIPARDLVWEPVTRGTAVGPPIRR